MRNIFMISILLAVAGAAGAQDHAAAESAMKAQQWQKAAAEYQKITAGSEVNSRP